MAHSENNPTAIGRTIYYWTVGGAFVFAMAAYVITS